MTEATQIIEHEFENPLRLSNVAYLEKKADQFNKKSRKLGVSPMEIIYGAEGEEVEVLRTYSNGNTDEVIHKTVEVKVQYEIPIIEGWELIATFDNVANPDGSGELVFATTVPGKDLPYEYHQKTEIHCDHCGINRFRNHSMLMKNVETGEFKEVGSTCVKDFFGWNPKGFLWVASVNWSHIETECHEQEESDFYEYRGQGYRQGLESLTDILTMTVAVIEEEGWVSKGLAYEKGGASTADLVSAQLSPYSRRHMKKEERIHPTDEHAELAKKTVEYFAGLTEEEIIGNDYLINCNKIAKLNLCPYKLFGYACSMINSYRKHVEKELEIERKKIQFGESDHVGEIKERLKNIEVTCIYKNQFQSDYNDGIVTFYVWVDSDDNKLTTYYSGYKWEMEQGEKATIDGTVKAHKEYKGTKQTVLTRVSVRDIRASEESEIEDKVNDFIKQEEMEIA